LRSKAIPSPYQALSVGWTRFSEEVKHRTRFLFLQELDDMGDQDTIPPGKMLDALGELFLDFELLSEMLEGTEFVRASIVNTDERPSTAAEQRQIIEGVICQLSRTSSLWSATGPRRWEGFWLAWPPKSRPTLVDSGSTTPSADRCDI
jgi:hypothetical protein